MSSLVSSETQIDIHSLRGKAVEAARRHKASWMTLGQYLSSIHKDKLYKNWGYLSFEGYCSKELRIKQTTAAKLVRSYSFLEREEPGLVDPKQAEEAGQPLPNFESVDLLRLAKSNDKFTAHEVAQIRSAVLTKALEPKEVRAQMKQITEKKAEEKAPAEVLNARRNSAMRRLLTVLTSVKNELLNAKLAPSYLIKQMEDLASKLQDQISD